MGKGPPNGESLLPFPIPSPSTSNHLQIYDFFHINAGAPNWRQASSAWLTVIVYMITYMDRVCISHAAKDIRAEYGFDAVTMGWIFSGVQFVVRALSDRAAGWGIGSPRRVLAVFVFWWSAFTAATSLALATGQCMPCDSSGWAKRARSRPPRALSLAAGRRAGFAGHHAFGAAWARR